MNTYKKFTLVLILVCCLLFYSTVIYNEHNYEDIDAIHKKTTKSSGIESTARGDLKANETKQKQIENSINGTSLILNANETKQKQIENYINGTSLILNVHITHHAGTSLCNAMRVVGPVPEFVCGGGENWPTEIPNIGSWPLGESKSLYLDGGVYPNETATLVDETRKHFHYVSDEFRFWRPTLQALDFDNPNLVSIISMRHPIGRFLAGGKCSKFHNSPWKNEHQVTPEDADLWWEYANSDCADNYALRILAPHKSCCSEADLESAKEFLHRMTFIIDQDCLDESLMKVGEILNISDQIALRTTGHGKYVESIQDRIANETLWDFLSHKFRFDIALYEWSKEQSVLKCSND